MHRLQQPIFAAAAPAGVLLGSQARRMPEPTVLQQVPLLLLHPARRLTVRLIVVRRSF
jgi:hypothetical protein